MVFIISNDFINRLFWSMAPPLALTDLLRASALVLYEVEHVKHCRLSAGFEMDADGVAFARIVIVRRIATVRLLAVQLVYRYSV